jgi:hypothetical protein
LTVAFTVAESELVAEAVPVTTVGGLGGVSNVSSEPVPLAVGFVAVIL